MFPLVLTDTNLSTVCGIAFTAFLTNVVSASFSFLPQIESLFKKIVEEEGMKLGKLAQPVRVALTGGTVSPGIYDVILLLGKEETLKRLKNVV